RAAAARLVELQPKLEDLIRVAGIDADAIVANAEPVAVGIDVAFEGDGPLSLRAVVEEERVGEKRADRFAHLLRIDIDRRQVVGERDRHLALFDLVVALEYDLFEDLPQRR